MQYDHRFIDMHFWVNLVFLLNLFLINIRGKCLLEFASFLQALGRAEGLKPKKKKKKKPHRHNQQKLIKLRVR